MDPSTLSSTLTTLLDSLTAPTTLSATLPPPADLSFERTLSRPLARNLDSESARILALVSKVLDWSTGETGKGELDEDMIQEGVYNDVIERVEGLLERADDGIEKGLGVGKYKNQKGSNTVGVNMAVAEQKEKEKAQLAPLPAHILHSRDLVKPQSLFPPRLVVPCPPLTETPISSLPLWTPILRSKPNALSPSSSPSDWLTTELHTPTQNSRSDFPAAAPRMRYIHPYLAELQSLQPPPSYFEEPKEPERKVSKTSFDQVPFEWVGDLEKLKMMVAEIREQGASGRKELAIDLEHHDLRSWSGVTCLIQVRFVLPLSGWKEHC